MEKVDLTFVDQAVQQIGSTPDSVIPILQALQEHYGYLPAEALERVCSTTQITPASISGVATFYDMFRHKPVGRFIVHVCRGTACHVAGAERIEDALRQRLRIPAGDETDPDRQFTIEPVACIGCCTLAPVVRMEKTTFGHVTAQKVPSIIRDFLLASEQECAPEKVGDGQKRAGNGKAVIHVGLGSCCMAKGSDRLFRALQQQAQKTGAHIDVKRVGCVGMCHRTPMIEVAASGKPATLYAGLGAGQASWIIQRHFRPRGLIHRLSGLCNRALDGLLLDGTKSEVNRYALNLRDTTVKAFLGRQVRIATEHFGKLDPLDLDEYLAHDGFAALRRCLENLSPEQTIETIERSGLRGRGGAGFPTGQKWRYARAQSGETKYVICNGDEGDPGAFMDRMILESFPFRVIEGLAISALAVGAHEGIFYIRREYPLAVRRVRSAIEACQRRGWLGDRLLGADYPLRLTIKEGAGAFVCGEETALIASVEGQRGMPRLRPPFPAEAGLWGKPTVINNVETLALVPWIIRHGAEAFSALGTRTSKGTKVFALAGKIRRGGLIEVPMGTTIREIVEEIGGGAAAGHRFKAVQIGGPSGGCIPARLADTPVDYESLREVGAIMGSGGLVVMDDADCMVDIARYFLEFTQNQSCGKCTFCRIGTRRMLDILDRLCAGKGQKQDLPELERLSKQVGQGSLCGLGKTAPNPVLTTLRYFREEYEGHLQGRCPARRCRTLIQYQVTEECTGCTICAQHCPVNAIPMAPYQRHQINQDLCTRCDTCRVVCPHQAIEVK
ncbi:MAG: NAD(P)H-dependent oxidoreductase subunit E [Verrucomicrobia bacterium]|nr:NAD(P)H-dependent oxidoreductase subunit E [Verrucomicrobiota bacterium]